jgi:hypothetical protein
VVGVVDGQGNVTVYTYDAVGNLLPIQRFTSGGGGSTGAIGIFFFAPASGPVGTQVTIQGFGFGSTTSGNQVAFNGTTATVVSATANAIVATVPSGATSGPITVTNANGTGTSAQAFTVLVPPIITGVEPLNVPQGATSRLNIAGFNLADATTVTFTQPGLTAAILSGATEQSLPINLVVGAAVPVGSYPFSLTTPVGTAQSGAVTVTVTTAVPGSVVGKASVFQPFPPNASPTGPGSAHGAASVFQPFPPNASPTGPGSAHGAASVFQPFPPNASPTGSGVAVPPSTSVSMP